MNLEQALKKVEEFQVEELARALQEKDKEIQVLKGHVSMWRGRSDEHEYHGKAAKAFLDEVVYLRALVEKLIAK